MRDELAAAMAGHQADYVEIHIEESESTRMSYRGRDLEEIGRSRASGGNVRAVVKGGWGFVASDDITDLNSKVATAVEEARLAGAEESRLAPVEPVVDSVPPVIAKDPRSVPLADKKRLLDEFNDIIWSTPKIQSSYIGYSDGRRKMTFANSDGSFIEQERLDVTARVSAIARKNGDVQQSGFSVGGLGDYGFMETLHGQVKETAEQAVALLDAPYADGGEYTVILDPILAGVFVHEAFGHLSESDFVHENPRMKEIMVLGKRFGQKHLNIVDGAALPGLRGSFKYDDEGTPGRRTDLIREGVLVGRLHSRETAATMGEPPSGNARAINYRYPPIVRMTNTIIEPGETSFEEMLADVGDGVYAKNWYGGTTTMEMFTFSAGEAYRIRKGRIEEMLRGVTLTGNLFTTLENIDAIGNDLEMNQGGGCGKGGQMPLPVSNGGPHIRIQKCIVGGR